MKKYLAPFLGVLIPIIFWQIIFFLEIYSKHLLPSPISVFFDFFNLFSNGIYADIFYTLYRLFIGLFLALLFAIPIGLFLSYFKFLRDIFKWPIDFFRSMPVTSLYPLFILFFGISNLTLILMVFFACFPIILISVIYGYLHMPKERILMSKSFGADTFFIMKNIVIRDLSSNIFSGVKIAISTSFIAIIISEMFLGTRYGLGQKIFDFYSTSNIVSLYSLLIVIGSIGLILNYILFYLEGRVFSWKKNSAF